MIEVTQSFLVDVLDEGDPTKIDTYFEPVVVSPLQVSLRVRDNIVVTDAPPTERGLLDVGLAIANPIQRMWRLRVFNRSRVDNPHFPVLVSEGDSWFQLFRAHDTIEWLMEDHSIWSLGAAGDTLAKVTKQNEVLHAIKEVRPAAFLLSAGGNDFLGDLETLLCDDPTRGYLGPEVDARMTDLKNHYRALFTRIADAEHTVPVICHGYDYTRPREGGTFVNERIAKATGIDDPAEQRPIIVRLVDRFGDMLRAVAKGFDGVHFIDLRGLLADDEWRNDEIHPSNEGYRKVAQRFRERIREALAQRP